MYINKNAMFKVEVRDTVGASSNETFTVLHFQPIVSYFMHGRIGETDKRYGHTNLQVHTRLEGFGGLKPPTPLKIHVFNSFILAFVF